MIQNICALMDPINKWLNWLIQGAIKSFWQNKHLIIILCGSCCIYNSHLSYPSHLLTTNPEVTYFSTVLVQSNDRLVALAHLKLPLELCLSFTHFACTDNDSPTRNKRIFYQGDFNMASWSKQFKLDGSSTLFCGSKHSPGQPACLNHTEIYKINVLFFI